ncbi:MAG: hypothetical protein J5497_04120 [Selenomonadaceae bacterium]|nr:hypothetical protein [Selenomonadaceae bacterium]
MLKKFFPVLVVMMFMCQTAMAGTQGTNDHEKVFNSERERLAEAVEFIYRKMMTPTPSPQWVKNLPAAQTSDIAVASFAVLATLALAGAVVAKKVR